MTLDKIFIFASVGILFKWNYVYKLCFIFNFLCDDVCRRNVRPCGPITNWRSFDLLIKRSNDKN